MSDHSLASVPGVYTLVRPEPSGAAPLIIDSPHSGALLPSDFHYVCTERDIRASEDTLVDHLIAQAPACGVTVLTADFTRSYLDLNRALGDIDPAMCDGTIPWPLHPTKRTQFGLGLLHSKAAGKDIYAQALPAQAVVDRVAHYYTPYHACLQGLVTEAHDAFGQVLHLNIHAMPSMTIEGKLLPDIVIGDLDGTSAHRVWRDTVKDLFKQAGFVVTVNTPYKGVEIIRRTGKPRQGQHALQIEINKALYLDEQTLQPHKGYADCISVMHSIWQTLSGILHDLNPHRASHRDAAE